MDTSHVSSEQHADMKRSKLSHYLTLYVNYYTIFVAFSLVMVFIASGIGYGVLHGTVGYLDVLFVLLSAYTDSGLATVDMSRLNPGFFAIMLVLLIFGSTYMWVLPSVFYKRWLYAKWYGPLIEREREIREKLMKYEEAEFVRVARELQMKHRDSEVKQRLDTSAGVAYTSTGGADLSQTSVEVRDGSEREAAEHAPMVEGPAGDEILPVMPAASSIESQAWRGYDGLQFCDRVSISIDPESFQRNAVLEYEAFGKMIFLWLLFYAIVLSVFLPLVFAATVSPPGPPPALNKHGISNGWFTVFGSLNAFHNAGMSLLNSSMAAFNGIAGVLILFTFLMVMGHVGVPTFLFLMVWIAKQLSREKIVYTYMLKHSRYMSPDLFSTRHNVGLALVQGSILIVMYVAFLALDLHRGQLLQGVSGGQLAYMGVFQVVASRNCGFTVLNLRDLAPAVNFLFAVVMFFAPTPYAVLLRSTSIICKCSDFGPPPKDLFTAPSTTPRFEVALDNQPEPKYPFRERLFRVFSRLLIIDLIWMVSSIFIVCIIESALISNPANQVGIFDISFELLSAYGNIGTSQGVLNNSYSLSGAFHPLAKVVVIIVMFMGRCRYLPETRDESVKFYFDPRVWKATLASFERASERLRELEARHGERVPDAEA